MSLIGFGASALIDLGVSGARAAQLTSAFFAAFLASRLGLCWVAPWVAPRLLVLAGLSGTAACVGVAALGAPALGFVLAGAFASVTFPAFYVWAVDLLGTDPRVGSAVLASCLLGASLGPAACRILLAATGEGALFGIVTVAGTMLTLAFALVPRQVRQGA